MKTFEDSKFNVAVMMIFVSDRIENTVGKGENVVYRCFPMLSFSASLKVGIVR